VKEAVDHAVSLQADSGEAWLAQAVYRYRVLRDFQSALAAYREAQKRLPNDSSVLEQMAHLERRLGQSDSAEQHYRAASALDPRNLDISFSLAELLQTNRRIPESNAVLDRALEIAASNAEALARKAFNFQSAGELAAAAGALDQIPENSPSQAAAIARAQQFIFERRFEEAIAWAQSSNLPPTFMKDPRSITMLGYCQLWAGRKQEAEQTFRRVEGSNGVIRVDARVLAASAILAYAGLGDKEQAYAVAQRALESYKEDALALLTVEALLAIAQAQLGDTDAAIATLSRLVQKPGGVDCGELKLNPFWDPLRKDPRFQNSAMGNQSESPAPL